MGLLQKIKSALGFDGTQSTSSNGAAGHKDVDVTVEREPSTASEDAVKGTETSADVTDEAAPEEFDDAEQWAEETEGLEADPVDGDTDEADGAADTAEPVDEDADADSDAADAEPDAAEAEPEPDTAFEGADDPVTEIKGIGPAYAERLSGLDIETVGDLATADAADIAAQTDLAETRVEGWVELANDY